MRKRFLYVILLSSIVISGTVGCSTEDETESELPVYLSFDTENAIYSIQDETDALNVINDVLKKYGLDDLEINQEECQISNILNTTSYCFSQTYEGIPVYGRKIIICADDDGQLNGMSNNCISLDGIELTGKISQKEAREIIEKSYEEEVCICNDGETIYSLYDMGPTLAWQFYVNGEEIAETCFVDVNSGEILGEFSDILADVGTYEDKNGITYFNTKKIENGTFLMIDEERNLCVYDAENLETKYAMVDESGNIYYCNIDTGDWYDDCGNNVIRNYDEETGKYRITDVEGYVLGEGADLMCYTENVLEPLEILSNQSDEWTNEKAAKSLSVVESTYDFFEEVLQRQGYDGNNGLTNIYVNDGWKKGGNAYSLFGEDMPLTMLAFGYDQTITADLVGHEFMHSVERTTSNMIYQNESGAIMEAVSDVFGELVEDWTCDGELDDDCDWIHGNRNMIDPKEGAEAYCYYERNGLECPVYEAYNTHTMGEQKELVEPGFSTVGSCVTELPYPDTYQGENYWTGSDDHGGVHVNNTVISHAFYLMTHSKTGIGLTNEELAKLLYKTLEYLLPDTDFNEFANAVYNEAITMQLREKKLQSIKTAFEQVGLIIEEPMVVKIDELQSFESANYSWVVEPTIEADEIFYLAEYPNADVSVNEVSKQADNPNAIIQQGDQLGIIDLNGKLLTEVTYKEIANFGDSYMLIQKYPEYSEKFGQDWDIYWLNKEGEIYADVGNGDLDTTIFYYYEGNRQQAGNSTSSSVQETIPVQESTRFFDSDDIGTVLDNLGGKYALEYDGALITDFIYDECGSLSTDLFAVCQNGQWGYVNEQGEVVIPLEYDASWKKYPVFDMKSSRSTDNVKEYCYSASDGYVVLCKNDKWELRDAFGKIVIPLGTFESICPVFDGKCWVKKDGKWGVIKLENSESKIAEPEITDEMLEGIWTQDESSDAVQIAFTPNGKVKYYATVSHDSDYTTTYYLKNNELTIELANIDGDGVTQLKYDLNYSENESIKTLNITASVENEDVDVSKLYGWDNLICGSYIQIRQEAVRALLGVPDDLEIVIKQSDVSYWDVGQIYTTYIEFEKNNGSVAAAAVNALTGELVKDILMYSDNSKTMTPEEICKIVAEHYNEEHNTDEYVVYENDCSETEDGYFLILRTKEDGNAWVYYVMVDLTTGKVVNDIGQEWYLD